MLKALRRFIISLVLLFLLGLGAFGYYFYQYKVFLKTPLNTPEQTLFTIDEGQGFSSVVNKLADENIIDKPFFYKIYGRLQADSSIKAGEYLLEPELTPETLFNKFSKGEVNLYKITFIEGWTFKQMLEVIRQDNHIMQTLEFVPMDEVTDALGIDEFYEGIFFPDTYLYHSKSKDSDILLSAYQSMQTKLEAAWNARSADNPLKNRYQLLILASIIEKETGVDSERGEIAGVFIRRLEKGMPLQTDPTVIYGLGDNYDGQLNHSELRQDTPYNTYTNKGLPPTPIAMPSEASLLAAANPKPGKASILLPMAKVDTRFPTLTKNIYKPLKNTVNN